ncbi:unnamed protein product, partial [Effrenium voratum]
TSGIARSRSGLDLEVADEHRGLECKAIPVARKSRTSPVGSNGKPPPSPAMSSREILEDLSMHGRTWPEPMAGLIGGKEANAGTAASTPAPFTRTRSRGETGAHEPSQCGGLRGESTERSAKSPHVWEEERLSAKSLSSKRFAVFGPCEDRRVRSLSPRGDRSQSPAGRRGNLGTSLPLHEPGTSHRRLRAQDVQSSPARSKTLQASIPLALQRCNLRS